MIYKNLIPTMGVCALALAGSAVQAGTPTVYYGGNLAALKYTEAELHDDATIKSFYGRIGLQLNSNFSGELRAGMGLRDEAIDVFGTDVDLELDHFYGAYLRGGFQASDEVSPYVIIGYTKGELTGSAPGAESATVSESDMSLGFGVDFLVDNLVTVNIEYMRYLDKDGFDVSGPSLGISSSF
jgi:opacity protein-like surface antigen